MADVPTPQVPTSAGPVSVPANVGKVMAPGLDMIQDPAQYAVNVAGMMEAITQPLFSYQSYPAGGPTAPLQFFQQAVGGAVTIEDTNMQLAAQLPKPQKFLVQGIGVDFISGTAVSKFGAETANGNLNDFYAVMKRGVLTLKIGSKEYYTDTSLLQLPVRAHIGGVAAVADATTAGANLQTLIQAGWSEGDVFKPRPLLIEAGQNFGVTIEWGAAAPAIPSADDAARIGVRLYGTLFRSVQ